MKEQWQQYQAKFREYWQGLSKKQKVMIIGTFSFLLVSMFLFVYVASKPTYVPLYSGDLSEAEIGNIKKELDSQGYSKYKLSDTGRMIYVPKKDSADIVVDLAAEGLPSEGSISYEVFSENMRFGATDRQLNVIERDAMQNELSNLLKKVDGISHAEVMITLPEESVFVRPQEQEQATASIIVSVEPGETLDNSQIRSLYYLVSRSVPKLPIENIVIMNQYSQLLEMQEEDENLQALSQYERQRKIKQQIEQDIQMGLQSMLGTIMGQGKVLVHTYVKLNFDQIKTQENLVEPVDEETNQGIVISAEEISRTFQGEGNAAGGIAGSGPTDIPGYETMSNGGNTEYEELESRINFDVNRIKRDIVQSPYQIEDITINVGVEPPNPEDPASLTPETEENIRQILANVIRTSLNQEGQTLSEEQINERITLFPRAFSGRQQPVPNASDSISPALLFGLGVIAALAVGGLAFTLLRRRRSESQEEETQDPFMKKVAEIPPMEFEEDSEEAIVRKQLENMAKDKPEDFAKLLRSWLAED